MFSFKEISRNGKCEESNRDDWIDLKKSNGILEGTLLRKYSLYS